MMDRPAHRPSPQLVIASIWLAVGGVNMLLALAGPHRSYEPLVMLGSSLCGLGVALLLSSATERLMRDRTRPAWPALVGLAVLGGGTVWLVDGLLQHWGSHSISLPPLSAFAQIRYNLVYFTLIFALQTSALALLSANGELTRRERQLAAAVLAEERARLEALQLQLNPHFLFNALNALATLTREARTADAGVVIARLADLLRATLAPSNGIATLDDELEAVQAYLEIEAMRFGDRLAILFDCQSDIGHAQLPVFTLQPLVENAIKHAVSPSVGTVTVEIGARRAGTSLILWVRDSGAIDGEYGEKHGFGIGLRNVAGRLQALYGDAGQLDARRDGVGFKATVRLPFRESGDA